MKRIRSVFTLFMIFALLVSFVGCGHRAVRSSRTERTVVMTLDDRFDVAYELYRFVFLQQRAGLDNGLSDKWTAGVKEKYFSEFSAYALEEICRIYAMFSLCEKYDIDPFARRVNQAVQTKLELAIRGDGEYVGYGDKKTYLAELEKNFSNDSVYRLYLRYDVCEELLAKAMKEKGDISATEEEARSYYMGEDTVRASWIYIPTANLPMDEEERAAFLNPIIAQAKSVSNDRFLEIAPQYALSLYLPEELAEGFCFGRYEYDLYYKELTEACFALKEGETSGAVRAADGIYIIRRLPKNPAYVTTEEGIEQMKEGYMLNCFYQKLAEEEKRLAETVVYSAFYQGLNFDSIYME